MNFRRNSRRSHAAIEAASLSDILFFLLFFFLIISTMASPSAIKIMLPKASSAETIEQSIINLSVSGTLDYYLEKDLIPHELLEQNLKARAAGMKNPKVILRVDRSIQVNDLVQVIEVVNRLQIPMALATQKE